MKHRSDIDGLRAVAVLPVLTFHAGFSQTPGGFVGVDVFFVISGFLITGIVAEELGRDGGLSLAGFYERRIRRIFPALFAMLGVTALAVSLLLTPGEVVDFARTLVSAVFSVSNVQFWLGTDYFGLAAHQLPLLHTWSLGVEEQFYMVMPLAMALLWRVGREAPAPAGIGRPAGAPVRVKAALALVAAASFGWACWGALYQPTASFYLLHTRAWELALGALLAVGVAPAPRGRILREILAAGGLLAIAAAVVFYDAETPFPGFAALAPCLGAAAILHAGAARDVVPTWTSRLLSAPPVVFFGLISYSLYLWHWPVIVLQRASFFLGEGLDPKLEKLLLVVVSVGLAWLSWRFVERPFRNRSWLSRRAVFALGAAGAAGLTMLAAILILADGFPERMSPQANQTAGYLAQDGALTMRDPTCMAGIGLRREVDAGRCLVLKTDQANLLLLGDSHSAHLWAGLALALPDANILQASAGGCRPTWPSDSSDALCRAHLQRMFETWLPTHRPDAVILAARWEPADVKPLAATLKHLRAQGIPVILMGPVPRYDQELPRLLINAETRDDPMLPQRHRMGLAAAADRRLATVAGENGVPFVSLYRALCPGDADAPCRTRTPDGAPMQYDGGHLTLGGSRYLGGLIAPQMQAAVQSLDGARAGRKAVGD
ncbi:MAG: acyltransferase family protein [Caulobacter sp.]|nr:acyltransferase family protein [Caulobacter sp.]